MKAKKSDKKSAKKRGRKPSLKIQVMEHRKTPFHSS